MLVQGKDLNPILDWTHNYSASSRRYSVLLGSMFKGIKIARKTTKGTTYIELPISYAVGKMYSKLSDVQDRETNRVATVLPMMTFELVNIEYDGTRQLNQNLRLQEKFSKGNGLVNTKLSRFPYNFTFNLHVKTKNFDEMLQIIEQICPLFQNDAVVTIEDLPQADFNIESDIRIGLLGFEFVNEFDGPLDQTKSVVEATFNFLVYGYLYTPTRQDWQTLKLTVSAGDLDGAWEQVLSEVSIDVPSDEQTIDRIDGAINGTLFEGVKDV